MTTTTPPKNNHDGTWFCITVLIMCICIAISGKCHAAKPAQLDTIPCKLECIQKILTKKNVSAKGNETVKHIVIYKDKELGIEDAIFMSKSVYEYFQNCSDMGISPVLGIKLKNREIDSIVRIRKKIRR